MLEPAVRSMFPPFSCIGQAMFLVIGAIGIVLFDPPETTLAPLIGKFAPMQRDLDDARRELATQRLQLGSARGSGARRPSTPLPASCAPGRRRWRSSGRRAGPRSRAFRCCCSGKPAPARNCSPMPSTLPAPALMVTIPDCGHAPALNQPSQLSLVADFLG